MPLEVFNFFFQHVVILVLPLLWLVQRRFTLFGGQRVRVFSATLNAFVFINLHFPLAIISSLNVNYTFAPPHLLHVFLGQNYRLVFPLIMFVVQSLCSGLFGALSRALSTMSTRSTKKPL